MPVPVSIISISTAPLSNPSASRRQFCARDELRHHRDGAACRHGVSCVQNDIEQDLTEVSFVHQDGEALNGVRDNRDVVRQEPPV